MEIIIKNIKSAVTYLLNKEAGENWTLNEETPEYLRGDETYVLNAIEVDVERAEFMSRSLANNKEFALKAVAKNGLAIQYFAIRIIGNKDVMECAITNNLEAIIFARLLTKDAEAVLTSPQNSHILVNNLISLKKQYDAKKELLITHMSEKEITELFDNKDFILAIVKRDGKMLKHASDKLRSDKDVVKAALDYVIFQ